MENPNSNLKKFYRLHFKNICMHLTNERKELAALKACDKIYKFTQKHSYVLSFASLIYEIDLWKLNLRLAQEERLLLPKVTDKKLEIFKVTDLNHLLKHPLGFLEPHPDFCKKISDEPFTTILVPGLGFDLKNNKRLGHGAGLYDRFLSRNLHVETYGIGFHEQAFSPLPDEPHDIALKSIWLF